MTSNWDSQPENDSTWTEEEYRDYLEEERRLFALALVEFGSFSEAMANKEALKRYPYEPPETPFRGLIFHDLAWHWAMCRIHGHGYWWSQPELQTPPESFGK